MPKVTINPGTLTKLQKKSETALPELCDIIGSDCNVYVRMQSGVLADSMRIDAPNIAWSTPYAKRVYYTGTPRKNRNPNASLQWCERAKSSYLSDWEAAAQRLLKE